MARLTSLLLLTSATSVLGFSPAAKSSLVNTVQTKTNTNTNTNTALSESFGFDFAEDQAENTPSVILGEANYKQWVGENIDNSFLNRQYNAVRRIRELDLLGLTAEYGILSKLEAQGVDLKTLESLLPLAEDLGLLSVVANNQQLLINGVAPLLIEPAPLLLPVVAGALEKGPSAFFGAAGVAAALEVYLLASGAEVPFVGLSAGLVAGLLLVPLTVVTGGLGVALSSASKN